MEDLYQIGCIGFLKSVMNFDFTKDNQLSTYATYMIIGEIKRFFRDNGPIKVSRYLKKVANDIKKIQDKYVIENGEKLNIEAISNYLKIDKEDIILAIDASQNIESIDATIGENENQTLKDKIADNRNEYEKVLNNIIIKEALNKLDKKERKIIMYRYYKEMTQIQIADLLNISQVQVSRIEKRAINKMKQFV